MLRAHINDHSIKRVPNGSRELLSFDGKGYYPWQFTLRSSLLQPRHLSFVANCFWTVYRNRYIAKPFQIAGVEAGATPVIVAILIAAMGQGLDVHAFSIRKERKHFGRCNIIEGEPNDLPDVVVDELTSPIHETMWIALNSVMEARLKLYGSAFVVVWKGTKVPAPHLIPTSQGNVNIESIYTLEDFDLNFEDYQKKRR